MLDFFSAVIDFFGGIGATINSFIVMVTDLFHSGQDLLKLFNEELLPVMPLWLVPFPLFVISAGIIYLILGGRDSK